MKGGACDGCDRESRLVAEVEKLRAENSSLKSRQMNGANKSTESLEAENRELKQMVDNLTAANSKLISSTKEKISPMEKVLDNYKNATDQNTLNDGTSAMSEQVKKLQQIILDESNARKKAVEELEALRQKMSSKSDLSSKSLSDAQSNVKQLQLSVHEKEKEMAILKQNLKAQQDDFTIKEKDLQRQIKFLQEETERLNKEGSSKLQETRSRLRKGGRRVLSDIKNLRVAMDAAKQGTNTLKQELLPIMKSFYQPLKKAVQRIEKIESGWKDKYVAEAAERKRLHNLVLELKGNIRVFCRVRPKLQHEDSELAIFFPEDGRPDIPESNIAVFDETKGTEKVFEFDRTFGPNSSQEQVFEEVEALVTSVLDGYNVCIFAYGQTGSGKTFTMEGSPQEKGINPRTLARLFEMITDKSQDFSYRVEFSILEIYNEEIKDLLEPGGNKKLEVRQGPDGNYVQDLYLAQVSSYDEVIKLWSKARENRTTFSNNINEHSSRSHLVLSVYARGENRSTGVQSYGKLHLVDLAGSERLSRTNATGDRLKEAQNINKSLSALGDVIAAAAGKQGHIPYRNSKLTHVLQDSLGQDSKTLMIVQSSPLVRDVGESICSLQFATRARTVELGQAKKHTMPGRKK